MICAQALCSMKPKSRIPRTIYEAGYAWPTMIRAANTMRDTRDYCRSCERCQKSADLADFPVEPRRPIIILEPCEMITVNYAGPFEATIMTGHSYMLITIDTMTGFAHTEATVHADGNSTIRMLKVFFNRHRYLRVVRAFRHSTTMNSMYLWVFG